MEVYSVLVTGANRGIGLEFVKQLVHLPKPPRFVFATYRSNETLGRLTEIKKSSEKSQVELIKMDVTKLEDVVAARKIIEEVVGENGLTLLINNAGIANSVPFPDITEDNLLLHFTANTIAPITVFQEILPLLKKAANHNNSSSGMRVSRAAVLNISSRAGSITETGVKFVQNLRFPAYKVSKAGLNMAMRVISALVKDQGILVVLMCPGWVKTDLGSDRADLTPEESISAMLGTLSQLSDEHHGLFMDRLGSPYPF